MDEQNEETALLGVKTSDQTSSSKLTVFSVCLSLFTVSEEQKQLAYALTHVYRSTL